MQRSVWRGALSFGLIYVPVDVMSASKDASLSLHFLDSRDFSGKEVDWAHIVKGYEYEKGHYVALSDADFKHANVKASETIEIANFTDTDQIPPMYFETPYYLSPQKGGQKVYSLLRQALQSTKKAAVGTFVMRGRQHLCVVVPNGDVLMLVTLRFANEVLAPAQVKGAVESGKDKKATPAEVAMARKLVEQMSGPFRPEAFKDTYRADLMRRIQEKIRNRQTHALAEESAPVERPTAQVIDLMEALRNSLKKKGTAARAAPGKSAKAKKRA